MRKREKKPLSFLALVLHVSAIILLRLHYDFICFVLCRTQKILFFIHLTKENLYFHTVVVVVRSIVILCIYMIYLEPYNRFMGILRSFFSSFVCNNNEIFRISFFSPPKAAKGCLFYSS